MFEVLTNRLIAPDVYRIEVEAARIALTRKAGQFVIVHASATSERIPLTIVDSDADTGSITLICQKVGAGTAEIVSVPVGSGFLDVLGPLGKPTHIEKYGQVCAIGGGVGVAPLFPIARVLKDCGNELVSIIGARAEENLILELELGSFSDELIVCTDNGSKGRKGFVSDALQDLLDNGRQFDFVIAVGPPLMMRAVAEVTAPGGIKTVVSLNPIMVDGTGMCGGCRVFVDGQMKFACVDGPEFDAHKVDFDKLISRLGAYNKEDRRGATPVEEHPCRLAGPIAAAEAEAAGQEPLSVKERMKIPRQEMPEQDACERIRNFDEVPLGYTADLAVREARRCLNCKNPKCVDGCPVGIDIPGFVGLIEEGDFEESARRLMESTALAAVCGRVCPQEEQCEKLCVRGAKGEPVAIGALERFVADYVREQELSAEPTASEPTGFRAAIVGSGPAGITCARELAMMGHAVTVFEAFHEPGGVLVYGIPEFRLPKRIVKADVDGLSKLGVRIELNTLVGRTITVDQLLEEEGFDAVFIASGAGLPRFLHIPGEDLNGVYSANEYLTRVNLMRAYDDRYMTPVARGGKVVAFGGGNVTMDSARTALRLGAESVTVVYRRSRNEMPARLEEIQHGEDEGVKFEFLVNPIRLLGDEHGCLRALECLRMRLGEPDSSGRPRPEPVPGSEFTMEADQAIVAIGAGPNPVLLANTPGLELNKWGYVEADLADGRTSREGVFAGGDIVTGSATVILAMGIGKRAAKAMDEYMRSRTRVQSA